ncbi:PPOX class F420-dependent oxidoreductase [Nocardioides marmorisolisilvae]|uniref:PPOX class F420-dependent oxidoreductase n=1 Tax=Nocardioides marmorisolisilvae TaxID=1542737 RepID=A0A3N0DPW2_9ACTN|nr:PPOX class F420-dependent oxidoreductase [Nocardioides marmorisolisilvae]RNL77486.1 PPOX class F420-dependent oxidoreductase [Nocardioides marmorisolisilvae]
MTDEQAWAEVGRAQYVSFTSYRKDGSPVSTPVWIAPDGDDLYFFSDTGAFKVKRVRNNPAVTLQPCDVRGRVKDGAVIVSGQAEVLEHADTKRVRAIVNRKYRIQGTIGTFFSRLRGTEASIGIRIRRA